jgi:hypothetical protein
MGIIEIILFAIVIVLAILLLALYESQQRFNRLLLMLLRGLGREWEDHVLGQLHPADASRIKKHLHKKN